MIKRLYKLIPDTAILLRLTILHVILAVLQGLLLGMLAPILRLLLQAKPDIDGAIPWMITGCAGLVIYCILNIIATPVGFAASMDVAAQLRHRIMRHVTSLPLGWFTGENKARLSRTLTAGAGAVAQLAVTIGAPAIKSFVTPLTIAIVVYCIDIRLGLLFTVIMPIALIALRYAGAIASVADKKLEAAATEIAGRAVELGQAQSVLRAAGKGKTGSALMQAALEQHRIVYRKGLQRSTLPDLGYTGLIMAGFVAVILFSVVLYSDNRLSVAETIVLLILSVRFLEPLAYLIELIGALHAMDNAIDRVQALLDTPALPLPEQPVTIIETASVSASDICFSYGSTLAINRISFHCQPGTTTALVGASGSGKTTLIRLIARFFDVHSGAIRIGGTDIRTIDSAVLMKDIAIIFQEVYLFDTTIEENIRMANPDADRKALEAAAKAAQLDEVIERLPDGWQTRVGEAGMQLSGGERQRVSIARAFLKQARIVLIDEAASALDPENERAISDAIGKLSRDPSRTVLVIAHRPATLAAADQVIVLDRGRIVETGTPGDLLQQNGYYARLQQQYKEGRQWSITT